MRLRPVISSCDFSAIQGWITDERSHALWCANLLHYPLEQKDFEGVLAGIGARFGDCPFVATADDGELVGFFSYSLNLAANEGKLKFVVVNPALRGKGYGKEMLRLAVKYAFGITGARAVLLNVVPENVRAKRCYESVGFREKETVPAAFCFQDEHWARCTMVLENT